MSQQSRELSSDEQTGDGSVLICRPGLTSEPAGQHASTLPRSSGSSTPTKRVADPSDEDAVRPGAGVRRRVQASTAPMAVADSSGAGRVVDGAAVGGADPLRAGSPLRDAAGCGPASIAHGRVASMEGSGGPLNVVCGAVTAECDMVAVTAECDAGGERVSSPPPVG